MPQRVNTPGEAAFERYLRDRGLRYEYEVLAGDKKPDFRVHAKTGPVTCEIKDFEEGKLDKFIRENLESTGKSHAVAIDMYTRTRGKAVEGAAQMVALSGTEPCVVVLYNSGSMTIDLRQDAIIGSMYGNLTVGFPMIRPGELDNSKASYTTDAHTAVFTEEQYIGISALAVLESFKPNAHLFHEEYEIYSDEMKARGADWKTISKKSFYEVDRRIKSKYPTLDLDYEVFRLRFYHNFFAIAPLDIKALNGPHDQHWAINKESCKFELCA